METVSLQEMLDARETRARIQQEMIRSYGHPLICLTLNIPGPVKILPGVPKAFEAGLDRIEKSLLEHGITPAASRILREKTGYEAFFSIDALPEEIKTWMTSIEDQDRLGRLFDIDVLRTDGSKVSREEVGHEGRRCLLCGEPACVCSRSRKHSVPELTDEIGRILSPFL